MLNTTPRILMAIENDKGNPTLDTLKKIGKPFGYEIGFIKRN
ncbi:hypothetical protein [Motiliproteus sp. MSK22-1]